MKGEKHYANQSNKGTKKSLILFKFSIRHLIIANHEVEEQTRRDKQSSIINHQSKHTMRGQRGKRGK